MKANKQIFHALIACFTLGHYSGQSQDLELENKRIASHHYLSLGVGPSFATNKQAGSRVEQRQNGTEYEHFLPTGYGSGFSINVGYTFLINKELGFELNVTKLFGSAFQYQNIYYVTDEENNDNLFRIEQNEAFRANLWKFGASFVGRFNYSKVSPYFKAGPIISTGNKLRRETNETYTEVSSGYKEKGEFEVLNTGGTSFGVNAVVGVDIPIFDKEMFFIELNYTGLSHDFQKYEMTKAAYKGQSVLSQMDASDKRGVYAESVSSTSTNELTFRAPLSSLSVMVGFRIAVGN